MAIDRKALKRQYLETPRPMGVCRLVNTTNGKCLVEASRNLDAVFNRHRVELRVRSHRNKELQADWDEFGEDAFTFEILETLEPLSDPDNDPREDLAFLEEHWLNELQPYGDKGYNRPPK
jgi:hypothetical protein